MESTDTRSMAIARLHLQSAVRGVGDSITLYRTLNVHKQDALTESLTVLGFDVNPGSEDFVVSPAQMTEVVELLILSEAGIRKIVDLGLAKSQK